MQLTEAAEDLGVGPSSGCLGVVLKVGVDVVDLSTLVTNSRLAPVVYGRTITHPLQFEVTIWLMKAMTQ